MQIDGATLVIALIFMVLMATPFVLDRRSRSRKAAALTDALRAQVNAAQCELHRHERCGELALGLDEKRKQLFLHDRHKEVPDARQVDLDRVLSCRVQKTENRHGNESGSRLERVELWLQPKDGSWSGERLTLYQARTGNLPHNEVEVAERWAAVINALLQAK